MICMLASIRNHFFDSNYKKTSIALNTTQKGLASTQWDCNLLIGMWKLPFIASCNPHPKTSDVDFNWQINSGCSKITQTMSLVHFSNDVETKTYWEDFELVHYSLSLFMSFNTKINQNEVEAEKVRHLHIKNVKHKMHFDLHIIKITKEYQQACHQSRHRSKPCALLLQKCPQLYFPNKQNNSNSNFKCTITTLSTERWT